MIELLGYAMCYAAVLTYPILFMKTLITCRKMLKERR